ncbi:hypothetical protein QJQ45_025656 [Haematococcus lacustris]|nr:hypothetical protein QJQ45_025656 [Haematococcus lacustris]
MIGHSQKCNIVRTATSLTCIPRLQTASTCGRQQACAIMHAVGKPRFACSCGIARRPQVFGLRPWVRRGCHVQAQAPGNLGQLTASSAYVQPAYAGLAGAADVQAAEWATSRIPLTQLAPEAPEATILWSSVLLLLLLLAVTFQRVLGLDRWVLAMLQQQQDRQRASNLAARQMLERSYRQPDSRGRDDTDTDSS